MDIKTLLKENPHGTSCDSWEVNASFANSKQIKLNLECKSWVLEWNDEVLLSPSGNCHGTLSLSLAFKIL